MHQEWRSSAGLVMPVDCSLLCTAKVEDALNRADVDYTTRAQKGENSGNLAQPALVLLQTREIRERAGAAGSCLRQHDLQQLRGCQSVGQRIVPCLVFDAEPLQPLIQTQGRCRFRWRKQRRRRYRCGQYR